MRNGTDHPIVFCSIRRRNIPFLSPHFLHIISFPTTFRIVVTYRTYILSAPTNYSRYLYFSSHFFPPFSFISVYSTALFFRFTLFLLPFSLFSPITCHIVVIHMPQTNTNVFLILADFVFYFIHTDFILFAQSF